MGLTSRAVMYNDGSAKKPTRPLFGWGKFDCIHGVNRIQSGLDPKFRGRGGRGSSKAKLKLYSILIKVIKTGTEHAPPSPRPRLAGQLAMRCVWTSKQWRI
jgi:hypothetical protein